MTKFHAQMTAWLRYGKEIIEGGVDAIIELEKQSQMSPEVLCASIEDAYFTLGFSENLPRILEIFSEYHPSEQMARLAIRCLSLQVGVKKQEFYDRSIEWANTYLPPYDPGPRNETRVRAFKRNRKRLRIVVTCDYAGTSVFHYAIAPTLFYLDRDRFEIILLQYSNKRTDWLACCVDQYIQHPMTKCRSAAEVLKSLEVDILVDMNGRFVPTASHYAAVISPDIPIFVNYGNMLGTWGTPYATYTLSDHYEVPEDEQSLYVEKVQYFDTEVMGTFEVPPQPINPTPALEKQVFVFAAFCGIFKVNAFTLELWAKLLKAAPKTKILIKGTGTEHPVFQQRVYTIFSQVGVDPKRVLFHGHSSLSVMFDSYDYVDCALNTYPYTAGTNGCFGLLKGVPILTLQRPGDMVSGGGSSIMHSVGLSEFVVDTEEAFISKGVEISQNLSELNRLRLTMPDHLSKSARYQPKVFAEDFSNQLSNIWEAECAAAPL